MSRIMLKGLGKTFGSTTILSDVDLDVADGEFVVLVGPSGCGKSTLLRMIAGLEPITSGELWIGDSLMNDVPPQKRNVAMVFQSYALFPHMTARDNIGFGLMVRGEDAAERARKVDKAAAALGLTSRLDRLPHQLSGGQRQRVAMGRSIVRDPHAFLFDEPLSNLDAELRVQMRAEMKSLHRHMQGTIIYVTHDQVEAMTMAQRIVVMRDGRIEQVGPPLDLYDRPVTRFVAGFLGSPPMSFIPATGSLRDDGLVVRNGAGRPLIVLPGDRAGWIADGRPIDLGVRPEDCSLVSDGEGLPFCVEVVEPTGAETYVLGAIDGVGLRCSFRGRLAVVPGDWLTVSLDPMRIHLFDAATGVRI